MRRLTQASKCSYTNLDQGFEREPDFGDALLMFAGKHLIREDDRKTLGEVRLITAGMLRERMVVVVWTPRNINDRAHHQHKEVQSVRTSPICPIPGFIRAIPRSGRAVFREGDLYQGNQPIRRGRGRPKLASYRVLLSVRYCPEVVT